MTSLAAVKAYEQAGLPVPAMAAIATSNEFNCKYLAAKADGTSWHYLASTAAPPTSASRSGTRWRNSRASRTMTARGVPFVYADSTTNVDPKCDETAPPDADLSSLLPPEKLHELFNQ